MFLCGYVVVNVGLPVYKCCNTYRIYKVMLSNICMYLLTTTKIYHNFIMKFALNILLLTMSKNGEIWSVSVCVEVSNVHDAYTYLCFYVTILPYIAAPL